MHGIGTHMGIKGFVVHIDLTLTPPDGIQGLMPDDAENPATPRATGGVEAGRVGPQADEGIVQDVFGQLPVAHNALGRAEKLGAIALIKPL